MKSFKSEAWKFYRAWRKEGSFCPALKREVFITLRGWRHISGATGAKKRTFRDMYLRLKLLPRAREIIEKATTVQNISERNGKKCYAFDDLIEMSEGKRIKQRKIRVIIEEDRDKKCYFLSVMSRGSKKENQQAFKSEMPHA